MSRKKTKRVILEKEKMTYLIKCDWCDEIIKKETFFRIRIEELKNKQYFQIEKSGLQTYDLCPNCMKSAKLPKKYKTSFIKNENNKS
jgi:hypothetical protein